jgi:hypothetical protein
MAATLAHEGNPRTNSLAITGTLDGGATLILVFPQGPILPVLPAGLTPMTISSPGPAKYEFSRDTENNNTFAFGNNTPTPIVIKNYNNAAIINDVSSAPYGWVKEYSFNLGLNLYGCILSQSKCSYDLNYIWAGANQLYTPAYRFNRTYWDMLGDQQINPPSAYNWANANVISGTRAKMLEVTRTPISGAAVLCDPESTKDDFTGLAAVYDWSTSTLYVMSYHHQSLMEFGTVLASTSSTMAATRFLSCEASRAIGEGNSFSIAANISSGSSVQATSVVSPYYGPNPANGLINIASSASHTAKGDESVTWESVSSYFDVTDVI